MTLDPQRRKCEVTGQPETLHLLLNPSPPSLSSLARPPGIPLVRYKAERAPRGNHDQQRQESCLPRPGAGGGRKGTSLYSQIPSTLFSLSLVSVANALATNGLIDWHSLLLVLISCLMKVPDGTYLCRSLGSASSPWRPSPSLLGGVGVDSDRNLKHTFSKPFASGNLEVSPLQCNLTGINFGDGRIETRESPDISACLSTTC